MRLIDKDELIKAFNDECQQECAICNYVIENDDHSLECELIRNFKEQPEIVRCLDCKRYYANGGNCDQVLADWFCADGERSVDTE